MTKMIGLRPTENAWAIIKAYMQTQKINNKSLAINKLIESTATQELKGDSSLSSFSQTEHTFRDVPPKLFCPRDYKWYLVETLMVSCPECSQRKICGAWK